MSVEKCKYRLLDDSPVLVPDENVICTTSPKGKTICLNDSGSPLTLNNTLIGIASFHFNCNKRFPDVFTNVFAYKTWIQSFLNTELEYKYEYGEYLAQLKNNSKN